MATKAIVGFAVAVEEDLARQKRHFRLILLARIVEERQRGIELDGPTKP